MIDLIIMGVAVYAVKRSWLRGYGAGQADNEKTSLENLNFVLNKVITRDKDKVSE